MNQLVTELANASRWQMSDAFGQNPVVKICNDEFSGIKGRPVAYFTFDDQRRICFDKFRQSMRGEIGYVPGAFAIWQHDIDAGRIKLDPATA